MDTNIIFLGQFGEANQHTLDWITRTGRWPDVVLVGPVSWKRWDALQDEDPLVARLAADYGEPVEVGRRAVLRRDGATTPPRAPQAPAGCAAAVG